ncbi:hypothetical protein AK812_SmicGene12573 [Symbiodinium microadriaticum]|uniref:Uncharacterized protein n=1 Tax=Symbiodinium microadriaticum TaxID=2951 RepID=A0A1Q9EA58_SYMMI|nr:hypothetical protein AK812_SmicGene12573 [Symbiodinium microadriaticum]
MELLDKIVLDSDWPQLGAPMLAPPALSAIYVAIITPLIMVSKPILPKVVWGYDFLPQMACHMWSFVIACFILLHSGGEVALLWEFNYLLERFQPVAGREFSRTELPWASDVYGGEGALTANMELVDKMAALLRRMAIYVLVITPLIMLSKPILPKVANLATMGFSLDLSAPVALLWEFCYLMNRFQQLP